MKERKFSIFLFALFFASLVWVSVNLGNGFQATMDIPVRVENLPPNKAVATLLPSYISVKIQGSGWQLFKTTLSPNLHYIIDFSQLSVRDTLFTSIELAERLNASSGFHVLHTSPEIIIVRIDEKISKLVPLIPVVNARYRDGFGVIGKMKASPDSIILFGARSLLGKINSWKTKELELHDVYIPIKAGVEISDSLWIQVSRSQTTASIEFDVQSIAEKIIKDIPIDVNQVPENRTVVLIPNKISIIIRSGVYTIAQISEKDFSGYIDYRSILLDTSGFVQPVIVGPENVKIVQQKPDKLQYVVRK